MVVRMRPWPTSGGPRLLLATALAALVATPSIADPLAALPDENNILVVGKRWAMPANPDVLGTAALDAGVTIYDTRFRRVSSADRDHPEVLAMGAELAGLDPVGQLVRAKQLVEARVRYATDLETMHVADYWSSAGDTLQRGSGDDEDIAIIEMQVLKVAGFSPRDLYISVGRHKKKGAHAVLIARTAQGFFMLDQAEPRVVPASASLAGHFVPMMTIGSGRSFLHGYRVGSAAAGEH